MSENPEKCRSFFPNAQTELFIEENQQIFTFVELDTVNIWLWILLFICLGWVHVPDPPVIYQESHIFRQIFSLRERGERNDTHTQVTARLNI